MPHKETPKKKFLLDPQTALVVSDLFRVLSDPARVRIIFTLLHKEVCVHEIADALHMNQSAVSHHLRILRNMRLVRFRKEGRHVFYSLDDEHVKKLLQCGLDHALHD